MRHYGTLWLRVIALNWRAATWNRVDFLVGNLSVLLNSLATAFTIGLLFYGAGGVRDWSLREWLYYLGLSMLARAVWDTAFIGMLDIVDLVRTGGLDDYRVMPASTLFLVSTSRFDTDTWGELLLGLALVSYGLGAQSGLSLIAALALTVAAVACGTLIYFSLHLLTQAASFWTQDNWAFTFLLWRLDETTSIPANFYPGPIFWGLSFFVPLAFVNYYPAAFLFGKPHGELLLLQPLVALALFGLSVTVWRTGLRHYQGSGT